MKLSAALGHLASYNCRVSTEVSFQVRLAVSPEKLSPAWRYIINNEDVKREMATLTRLDPFRSQWAFRRWSSESMFLSEALDGGENQ